MAVVRQLITDGPQPTARIPFGVFVELQRSRSWRPQRSGAHQRPLPLDPGQDLLPECILLAEKSHHQRLIEIDLAVEDEDRALRLALPEPLIAEARAQRDHVGRAE